MDTSIGIIQPFGLNRTSPNMITFDGSKFCPKVTMTAKSLPQVYDGGIQVVIATCDERLSIVQNKRL